MTSRLSDTAEGASGEAEGATPRAADPAPLRRVPWTARSGDRQWPGATHALLLATGVVLALGTLLSVLNMPDLPYHPARDLELRATYDTYRDIGVPLVKENGTGSWYGGLPGTGLTKAAGDDDPGSYLIASWMGHLTGSASPYPGLRWAMALLCALPMLILPVTVARIFGRARAGIAMLALPALTWLVNGTVLTGTEYGLSDAVSVTPVYALYGLPASMIFLSLVTLAYAVSRRPGVRAAIAWTVLLVLFAACANLMRSLSGAGVALAVAVVWWVAWTGRLRWAVASGAAVLSLAAAFWLPGVAMDVINESRNDVVIAEASRMTDSHGKWHNPYLGLSYPTPITGEPSAFGVEWSDEFGWNKAREVDPDVVVGSAEYDAIMKDLYFDEVTAAPVAAIKLYMGKTVFILKHFAAMLAVIGLAAVLVWRRPGSARARLVPLAAASLPTLLLGLVPTVLVMPMLYYFTELAAGLGFLLALALGALAWTLSTSGSVARSDERALLQRRLAPPGGDAPRAGVSVVVCRGGGGVSDDDLDALAAVLGAEDEMVVVDDGAAGARAGTSAPRDPWARDPRVRTLVAVEGTGDALRTGVLASTGARVLVTQAVPGVRLVGPDTFEQVPPEALLAVASRAHPASCVDGRWHGMEERVTRWLRSALLSSAVEDPRGPVWVDGDWARSFAAASREKGALWFEELVLAAEQQGIAVWEVPIDLSPAQGSTGTGPGIRGVPGTVRDYLRLALRKDDHREQRWVEALPEGR